MTEIARWGLLELAVGNAPATVQFHHESGHTAYVESFTATDGELLRFMPSLEGNWHYTLADEPRTFTRPRLAGRSVDTAPRCAGLTARRTTP
jgi:hypothetical protein